MSVDITMQSSGGEAIVSKISRKQRRLEPDVEQITQQAARMMLQRVQELAPKDTGTYAAEIHIQVTTGLFGLGTRTYSVVTDFPAARRLELGFVGVDALGRHYDQAPRPHWRPAAEEATRWYDNQMRSYVRGVAND